MTDNANNKTNDPANKRGSIWKNLKLKWKLSLVAGVMVITLIFVTRSIIEPLHKGVKFAETVAKGDLTQRVDIDQTGDR